MEKTLQLLLEAGKPLSCQKREFLTKRGTLCKRVYYIKSGVVRHFVITRDGHEKTIRLSTENDFFYGSIVSHFTSKPSYIASQALVKSELLHWDSDQLDSLFKKHPGLLEFRNQQLVNFILEKHNKEIDLLTKDAQQRVKEFQQEHLELFNRIPHHIIASYLDITPETLSRLRAKLLKH